ncbi:hypothetical protein MYAM1_001318 [Malassezia yamatoensis]|uniref:SET domain-containing protein n=1 Tax=Malassezia yamatoensis TaxID=253288 RepID=A0AAJ5YSQ8_9BASI|nr:hypothetical protein MYAM1_001318 [Malassezia yamatoensis]
MTYSTTSPETIRVVFQDGEYNSRAVAARVCFHKLIQRIPAGEQIAQFDRATLSSEPRYSTVQTGETLHLELNSDLLYCNHSCDPTLEFHVDQRDIRKGFARSIRDIQEGEPLTFFYPSTEWHMAQPFECNCNAHYIAGADSLSMEQLQVYFLNEHILRLKAASTIPAHDIDTN